MNDFFDNRRILEIIWNRRIHFMIIGVMAVILAAVFSAPFFITPKYKASARIYPTNLGEMSEESTTEQMLEIINSRDVKFKLFDSFGLHDVYRVRKDDPLYDSYMLGIFSDHFAARKTEFETVEIEILDVDPVRARQMCDSVISFYNAKVRTMHSVKYYEMAKILEDNLKLRKHERDSIMDLLVLSRMDSGILDYELQVPEVTRGWMRALADGRENTTGGREMKRLYDNMLQMGAESQILESRFSHLISTIDSLRTLYDHHLSEAQKSITYSHMVERARVPDKKAYPVRWLIVAFTLISALFAGLIAFLILDYKK